MDSIQALLLGAVQGLTEFIPVSSSGHLVLAEAWLGLKVESLKAFDVMVHMGTLVAIFGYFWKDFWYFILAVLKVFGARDEALGLKDEAVLKEVEEHKRWLGYIVLGSVPAAVIGVLYEDLIDETFRHPMMVGGVMMVVGVLFLVAEWSLKRFKGKEVKFGWGKALLVGMAQAVALIPGVSRSGSTIATAISMGIPRDKAARFSFLLGAPAIFGAGLVTALKMSETGWGDVGFVALAVGFVSSAVVGYLCVAFLMKFLRKHTLLVFAIYLLVLGWMVVAGFLFLWWTLGQIEKEIMNGAVIK